MGAREGREAASVVKKGKLAQERILDNG